MHYKNGREAKAGDVVLHFPTYSGGFPSVGVVINPRAEPNRCVTSLLSFTGILSSTNLDECLHFDDVKAVADVTGIPDSTVVQNVGEPAS